MPNVRRVYISRSNIYFLGIVIGLSFFTVPNAFFHPSLCVIWWACILLGLNSIREANKPMVKKSRSQLIDEIIKRDQRIKLMDGVNRILWIIIKVKREKEKMSDIRLTKNNIIGMRVGQR